MNYESTHGYFIYNAMTALASVLNDATDSDLLDGLGHTHAVGNIVDAAGECIAYFDAKYLHPEYGWDVGVYDYEVWDACDRANDKFYRFVALKACEQMPNLSYPELVDAYAKEKGWKPGMGGTGE